MFILIISSIGLFDWYFHKIPNRLISILLILALPDIRLSEGLPYLIFFSALYCVVDIGAGDLKFGSVLCLTHPPHSFISFFIVLSFSLLLTWIAKRKAIIPMAPAISVATLF